MCIKIVGESEFNAMVFLTVDTNSGFKSLDINKEDIVKNAKQLIDTAYGLLEIADSDRDSDQYENAMNLLQEAVEALDNDPDFFNEKLETCHYDFNGGDLEDELACS